MSTRVHPIDSRANPETKPGCPCSFNFSGHCTCCKGCLFFICVILISYAFSMAVAGIVLFGTCIGNTVPIYMIAEGSVGMLFVFLFMCWLCNRCIDATSIVMLSIFFITILSIGSVVGFLLTILGVCDSSIVLYSNLWSFPLWMIVALYVGYRMTKTECCHNSEECCLDCSCDCEAYAVRLIDCLD